MEPTRIPANFGPGVLGERQFSGYLHGIESLPHSADGNSMFLAEPQPTGFDLRFQIFGFPVRVHPAFFLMPLILGGSLLQGDNPGSTGVNFLVLTAVFFVAILVHELGHAFAMRYFGESASIVLYWMGGLAIPNMGRWNAGRARPRTPYSQLIISAAGPLAGILLGLVLVAVLVAMGGKIVWETVLVFPIPMPDLRATAFADNQAMWVLMTSGMFSCFFWNLLNLAPVLPLDGGRILQSILTIFDPWNGTRTCLVVSMITAGALALLSLSNNAQFGAFFFGFMAFESFQALQSYGGGRR
ncbi:MAG: metalloprotease [Planctomycetota bacterium]